MPLTPPWKYATDSWPADGQVVWCVRIGEPEKPFQATFNLGGAFAVTFDPPGVQTILWFIIYKWRPL